MTTKIITRIVLILGVLIVSTLACNFINDILPSEKPTPEPVKEEPGIPLPQPTTPAEIQPLPTPLSPTEQTKVETTFPIPPDAQNVQQVGAGDTITFMVKMTIQDVTSFYRDTLPKQGYQEDKVLTSGTPVTFSIVFRGSGAPIVVQGVDMGGTIAVSIRHEESIK